MSTQLTLQCAERSLDLSAPCVMGVLNVTPDSFSDGGALYREGQPAMDRVLRRVEAMIAEGASLIDVGGESTRPGAVAVSPEQELSRVLPVVEAIAARFDTVISVDTSTAELMKAAAEAGAGLINDVRALQRPGALEAASNSGLPVCLMHMRGEPATMQQAPCYNSVVEEVSAFLLARVDACRAAGIANNRLLLDPGFGFGKSVDHNLALLRHLPALVRLGYPVLVGLSRKSLIAAVTGRPVEQRLAGSVALAALAVGAGALIIRAHDVAETLDAVRLAAAVYKE